MNSYKKKLLQDLSPVLQKKMSIAVALMSDPKILIIENPTEGLDPNDQQEIWNVIMSVRDNLNEKAIIVTTKLMEEADILGDRIIVLDDGFLIAHGTPKYMRKKFGSGYSLNISKFSTDAKPIDVIVLGIMSRAKVSYKSEFEIIYNLTSNKAQVFKILKALEDKKEILGIIYIGISISTLDDVYLKILERFLLNIKEKDINIFIPTRAPKKSKFKQILALYHNHGLFYIKTFRLQLMLILVGYILCFLILTLTSRRVKPVQTVLYDIHYYNLTMYGTTNVYVMSSEDVEIKRLVQIYKQNVLACDSNFEQVKSVEQALISRRGSTPITQYWSETIISAKFNRSEIYVMYSHLALHGAAISLNMITNTFAKAYLGAEATIKTGVFALRHKQINSILFKDRVVPYEISIIFVTGAATFSLTWIFLYVYFVATMCTYTGFMYYPLRQKMFGFKNLIFMTGVSSGMYWIVLFTFDAIWSFIILFGYLIVIWLSFNPIFQGYREIVILFYILNIYGVQTLPLFYIISYKKSLLDYFNTLLLLNTFGTVAAVVFYNVQHISSIYVVSRSMHVILNQISPQYWISYSLIKFIHRATNNYQYDIFHTTNRNAPCSTFVYRSQIPCCKNFTSNACRRIRSYRLEDVQLYTLAILFMIITITVDCYWIKKLCARIQRCVAKQKPDRIPVTEMNRLNMFAAQNISKYIGTRLKVNNITFSVPKGNSFGILGNVGSGKTTFIKTITTSCFPNYGTAFIIDEEKNKRRSLVQNTGKYATLIGYCPKLNCFDEDYTARETLTFFSLLRGNLKSNHKEVESLLETLGLREDADMKARYYTNVNKRKLSIGIALIGSPPFIIINEPTLDLDPYSKKSILHLLKKYKEQRMYTFLIATEKYDECELLCDDIAVLDNGRLCYANAIWRTKMEQRGYKVCLVLKRKSLSEYRMSHSLLVDAINQVFIERHRELLNPELKEKQLYKLMYYVYKNVKLSDIFQLLEHFKFKNNEVDDYTITMITLEDEYLK